MHPYLRPTAAIARDAILPGDPKRAMELATRVTERPLMSNLSRGLWGYHGTTAAGLELTVQSTGIGAPSAAIVLSELAGHGVERAVRVGTATAIDPGLRPGDVVVVSAALAEDGASARLEAHTRESADPALTLALERAARPAATALVGTIDLPQQLAAGSRETLRAAGASAVEMCAAPLFAVGRLNGIAVACALVIGAGAGGERLDPDALDEAALELGERVAGALSAQAPEPVP